MGIELQPIAMAVVTGILGILGGLMIKRVEKAPDAQASFSAAAGAILEQYRLTLVDLSATVTELRDEVNDLNDHIDVLTREMRQHGIPLPPRKKRAGSTEKTA